MRERREVKYKVKKRRGGGAEGRGSRGKDLRKYWRQRTDLRKRRRRRRRRRRCIERKGKRETGI